MPEHRLGIRLEARDDSRAAFDSLKRNMEGASRSAQSSASTISRVWQSGLGKMMGVIGGATAALAAFKVGVLGAISAASQHEDSLRRLQTAVELAGGSWSEEKQKIVEFTDAMQEQSRFSNTEMVDSMQTIVQMTLDVEKGYEGARVAADLASVGMFNLETASRYVGMAMAGEVTMLGRYIPQLKEAALKQAGVTTAAERAEYAMRVLNNQFGGAAQAAINTYGGQVDQLKNAFADAQREIGEALIPVLTDLLEKITPIVSSLASFVNKIHNLAMGITELSDAQKDYIEKTKELDEKIKAAVVRQFEMHEASRALAAAQAGLIDLTDEQIQGYKDMLTTVVSVNTATGEITTATLAQLREGKNLKANVDSVAESFEEYTEKLHSQAEAMRQATEAEQQFYSDLEIVHDISIETANIAQSGFRGITLAVDETAQKLPEISDAMTGVQVSFGEHLGLMLEDLIGFSDAAFAAWQSGLMKMADAHNTFKKSREAAWDSFKRMALMQISQVTWAWITGEKTKSSATVAGFAARLPTYIAEGAAALASAAKSIYNAVAGIFSWAAKIPFVGIAIGAGLVAAMMTIIGQFKKFQTGGLVYGPAGPDRVPAMLTAGEYIIPADVTARHLPLLEALKQTSGAPSLPMGYQGGGIVTNNDNSTSIQISVSGAGDISSFEELLVDRLIPALENAIAERRFILA